MWYSSFNSAASFLIALAAILRTLSLQVSQQSQPILESKVRQLLRAKQQRPFEELLTELHVASIFSEQASPIALEPLVPRNLLDDPNRPSSPDIAVRLHDGIVEVEVTVFSVQAITQWEECVNHISGMLQAFIDTHSLLRTVSYTLPVGIPRARVSHQTLTPLFQSIREHETGSSTLDVAGHQISFNWEPVPVFFEAEGEELDGASLPDMPLIIVPQGATVGAAASIEYRIVFNEDAQELVLRSLRNTLNGKRKQFPNHQMNMLIVRPGNTKVIADAVRALIEQRIWPNPQYSWITGVGVLTLGGEYGSAIFQPRITASLNPNASTPASPNLIALLGGEETFHFP